MSEAPSISVIMAVYNGEMYLHSAVESVLDQKNADFEFIIVEDHSTDHSLQILNEYKDPRIRVITNKHNLGLPQSLNLGIRASKGEYIARQDADDVSHPERLSKQMAFIKNHPEVGVIATSVEWIDDFSRPFRVWPMGDLNPALQEKLLYTCPIIHGSTLFRRFCFEEARGYNEEMTTGQDYDLWLKISETWDIVCLPEVLYSYRRHDQMVSEKLKVQQSSFAKVGLQQAIDRRLQNTYAYLGITKRDIPTTWQKMGRNQLSQRLVWWSAGARSIHKVLALKFLLLAIALDPLSPHIWDYLKGIGIRKLRFRDQRMQANPQAEEPNQPSKHGF